MRQVGVVGGGEDGVWDEVYIEDDGDSWDDVQEEKEGEEIPIDVEWTQQYFNGENDHDDDAEPVEERIHGHVECGRAEVICEKWVDGQDCDEDLVFHAEWGKEYLPRMCWMIFLKF